MEKETYEVKFFDRLIGTTTTIEIEAGSKQEAETNFLRKMGLGHSILEIVPIKVQKNKFKNKKVIHDGIKFDSKMEKDYYEHLIHLQNTGVVTQFFMQRKFLLTEAYTRNDGSRVLASNYIADFEVHYYDGRVEVIDVKGKETDLFKLKRKIVESKYGFDLKLVTNSKIDGGWIELKDLDIARKERRKQKELAEQQKNNRLGI